MSDYQAVHARFAEMIGTSNYSSADETDAGRFTMNMQSSKSPRFPSWLVGLLLSVVFGCTAQTSPALICHDIKEIQKSPWILRLNEAKKTAEMIVHVPTDSINIGVPPGNRRGRLVASERTYQVVIPADSGGQGQQAWSRMQFAFEIDRFTNNGTLAIGEERYGEVPKYQIRCEAGPQSPRL